MNSLNAKHYVPVLRWKRGERIALSKMKPNDINRVTPLIELVNDNYFNSKHVAISNEVVAENIKNQLLEDWCERPIFIDAGFLSPEIINRGTQHPLSLVSECVFNSRIPIVPVTGLTRDDGYQSAVLSTVRKHGHGACIRLTKEDIRDSVFHENLSRVTTLLGLSPEETDLIVDFKIIDSSAIPYSDICEQIPDIINWRNFVVVSGAFPKDLTGFEKNRVHRHRRDDWLSWSTQVISQPLIKRLPVYGDYTIQFPEQILHTGFLNISASIRYTADHYWVIMRGEGIQNEGGPGPQQWPAWALLLCDEEEYCGDDFSYGDRYIKDMSREQVKTGSAETWLRAGINHHMTFVVHQLATLP